MTAQKADPYGEQELKAAYAEACEQRDRIEARVAPLRAAKTAAANEAEVYRVKAMDAAAALTKGLGGASWFALKKRIGRLAKLVGGK